MKKIAILIVAAFLLPLRLMSQGLHNEITVEHDVIPEQRDAVRLGFLPRISLNPVQKSTLQYSRAGITTQVPPGFDILDPAAYGDTVYTSPWKGYVRAGIFPFMFNSSVSAGYRVIDNEKTHFGAWLQYDGTNYQRSYGKFQWADPVMMPDKKTSIKHNTITLGGALLQKTGKASRFELDFGYTYANYNRPAVASYEAFNPVEITRDFIGQGLNRFNVDAGWRAEVKNINFGIKAGLSRFAFTDASIISSARQNQWKGEADASVALDDKSKVKIAIDFSYLQNSQNAVENTFPSQDIATDIPLIEATPGADTWLLRLKPSYILTTDKTVFDAGVKIDFTHNAGKGLHIAPDVRFSINPKGIAGITLYAGGGEMQNSLAFVYDRITPYIPTYFTYSNAHLPITFGADLRFGPVAGFYASVYGQYAKANDWLMPSLSDDYNFRLLEPVNMSGLMVGAKLGYRYGKIAEAKASVEFSPRKFPTRGYYLWFDRAKMVVSGSLIITPISPLDITVDYTLRTGRVVASGDGFVDIGNMSDLDIGVTWRFNDRFSAFLRGENLLNGNYLQLGFVPSQGLNGLIGIAYKF